jgi:threonine dehydrogenase-like Zn-dependent dehydrogenase
VAEIVAVGTGVSDYRVGDRILTNQSHRSAFICPAEKIIARIPKEVSSPEASVTYLYQLGYSALLRGSLCPGHHVFVVGLGTLGLATLSLASLFGANAYGVSRHASSLKLAEDFGARKAVGKDDPQGVERLAQATGEGGADLVVTTSNSWDDWRLALRLARRGGTIAVLGFPGRAQGAPDFNPLDSQFFYDRQLTLVACGLSPDRSVPPWDIRFTLSRNCAFLLDLIRQKRIPAGRLVSDTLNWADLEQAYQRVEAGTSGPGTFVLEWKK